MAVFTALAFVGAVVLSATLVTVLNRRSEPACRVTDAGSPTCGAWWGSALHVPNSALAGAVSTREAQTRRRLDIVHTYHRWQDTFPTASETALANSGHLLFLNWEPVTPTGESMAWSKIAAGASDATIKAEARRLAALGRTVLVSFSHEPELGYGDHGDAAAFAAAFRHVVEVSRAAGATNVRWVWNLMGLTDPVWQRRYHQMWPGDEYVDWIAWDPYNFASCRSEPWETFTEIVRPFYAWLQDQGFGHKPFMLAEFGTVEGGAGDPGKAQWLSDIPAAMADFTNLRALVYFDLPAPPASCDWLLSTSTAAQSAYRQVANASAFRWTAGQDPTG